VDTFYVLFLLLVFLNIFFILRFELKKEMNTT